MSRSAPKRKYWIRSGGPIQRKPVVFDSTPKVFAPAIKKIGKAGKRRASAEAAWRKAVKDRDGHVCQICKSDQNLEAHHLIAKTARGIPLRFVVANGVTLCYDCHQFGPESAHGDIRAFAREWAKVSPEFAAVLKAHGEIVK